MKLNSLVLAIGLVSQVFSVSAQANVGNGELRGGSHSSGSPASAMGQPGVRWIVNNKRCDLGNGAESVTVPNELCSKKDQVVIECSSAAFKKDKELATQTASMMTIFNDLNQEERQQLLEKLKPYMEQLKAQKAGVKKAANGRTQVADLKDQSGLPSYLQVDNSYKGSPYDPIADINAQYKANGGHLKPLKPLQPIKK